MKITKQQLQKMIDNLPDEIDFDENDTEKNQRWIPETGEEYYFVDLDGEVRPGYNQNEHIERYLIPRRQIFKTKIEAEEYKKAKDIEIKIFDIFERVNQEPDAPDDFYYKSENLYRNIEVYYLVRDKVLDQYRMVFDRNYTLLCPYHYCYRDCMKEILAAGITDTDIELYIKYRGL